MEEQQGKVEAKSVGVTPNRIATYQKIAIWSDKIINTLLTKLDSRTESISLGAANKLIDKILPDLKATELTGENNGPVLVKIVYERNLSGTTNPELPQTAVDLRPSGSLQDSSQGSEVRTD